MALIALRESPGAKAFGLMVLGSPDEQRFCPDMGTAFPGAHGGATSAALGRFAHARLNAVPGCGGTDPLAGV